MKKLFLSTSLLAVAALSFGQDAPKIAVSEAFDLKGNATTVVAAEIREFNDVLGHSGVNLHLKGLVQPLGEFKVGTALTYDLHKTLPLAKGFSPILDASIGPWCNYGLGAGKLSGGLYVGLGLRF